MQRVQGATGWVSSVSLLRLGASSCVVVNGAGTVLAHSEGFSLLLRGQAFAAGPHERQIASKYRRQAEEIRFIREGQHSLSLHK